MSFLTSVLLSQANQVEKIRRPVPRPVLGRPHPIGPAKQKKKQMPSSMVDMPSAGKDRKVR